MGKSKPDQAALEEFERKEVFRQLEKLEKEFPATRQHLIAFLQEKMPYVVQRQVDAETGEWKNVGAPVTGKSAAFDFMNKAKESLTESGDCEWRVLQKNEADKLLEGIKIGIRMQELYEADEKRPKPLMYMPEHL